ncbi:MAG: hypothetical protein UT66_C0001G0024 [candidate division CPR2 bacterium GW2011_GWC1_39_9]|uniref:Uncharacterized protein n=1 Tax=candidate division CPR2 bacterium GW2011_GWC2_39_10 TaxID=1618345 RepID=A0A0G0PBC8_UNCC2|nr:MAG: hypothetical protein UT18_C0001G0026 [candidate division CPR2 bacterium GW2011_GWC2_39_10]KKR36200.1 MAG: hypothetical protein UT66_C0001G0024 [candidate division CPR2 bacterium GW2011_GWC1_39_9]
MFKKFVMWLLLIIVLLLPIGCSGAQMPNEFVSVSANLDQYYEKPTYKYNGPSLIWRFKEGDAVPWSIKNTMEAGKDDGSLTNYPDVTLNNLLDLIKRGDPNLKDPEADRQIIYSGSLEISKGKIALYQKLVDAEILYLNNDKGWDAKLNAYVWDVSFNDTTDKLSNWGMNFDKSDGYFDLTQGYDIYVTEWKMARYYPESIRIEKGYLKVNYDVEKIKNEAYQYFYEANDPKAPKTSFSKRTAVLTPNGRQWKFVKFIDSSNN